MARLVKTGKQRRKRSSPNNAAYLEANKDLQKAIRQKWKRTAPFDASDEERLRLADQKRERQLARQARGMASVAQD